MFSSSYRLDQYGDAELFAIQLGVVFGKYEIDAVEAMVDVRNDRSLQLTHKFPPTLQEVAEGLEGETRRRKTMNRGDMPSKRAAYVPPPRPCHPGCRANVLVRKEIEWFETVKTWALGPDVDARDYRFCPEGIWIALNIWLDIKGGKVGKWVQPSLSDIGRAEAEYQAAQAAQELIDDHRGTT